MADLEKFPGAQREGTGIDSTIEDLSLWDERERIAKRLYAAAQRRVKPGTWWAWEELNERTRKPWREMAYAEMQGAAGVLSGSKDQPNGGK